MGQVILDMSISLDGYIAGPEGTDVGLHTWYFTPESTMPSANKQVIEQLIDSIGAMIIGKRSYDLAVAHDGFVDNPYAVPHIVLTNHVPSTPAKGSTPLSFSNDIHAALEQAQAAAGTKAVCIAGGADVAQQYLQAGLVDRIQLHLIPILVGDGLRLWANDSMQRELECIQVLQAPDVIHLHYQIAN